MGATEGRALREKSTKAVSPEIVETTRRRSRQMSVAGSDLSSMRSNGPTFLGVQKGQHSYNGTDDLARGVVSPRLPRCQAWGFFQGGGEEVLGKMQRFWHEGRLIGNAASQGV